MKSIRCSRQMELHAQMKLSQKWFFFKFYDAKFNEHEWLSFKQIFRFQLIELHFFAVGINFVDQLTSMEITTNYIFKNGVNQLQILKSVLTNLYQKLRTIVIRMGYQKTFGRSFLLFEVAHKY